MPVNNAYQVTEVQNKETKSVRWKSCSETEFSYDDAINLAGIGWYTRGLLLTMSLSILGMAVDMFGFSIIVTGCACDFNLDHQQKTILISVPFLGPIMMAYAWGYLSDTKGRKWTLLVGLWGGFIASTVSSFSSHWYMLAVLKIVGTSFSSAVQSTSFTMMGESCPGRVKSQYLFVMTAAMLMLVLAYVVPGYFILNLNFSYDLGLISFTPWRLLSLVLASPLGISAVMLHFYIESPKFLLSSGREEEALKNLNVIWQRNGGKDVYPVKKLKILNEQGVIKKKEVSLLASLFDQILPLFNRPLLWTTLRLFYLTSVVYGVNNSLMMWMPIIVESFTDPTSRHVPGTTSLCDIISSTNTTRESITCDSRLNRHTLISGIGHGLIFGSITLAISKLAYRKKLFTITFLFIPLICTLIVGYIKNDVASLVFFVGSLMTSICMGTVFSYFVDLYPTAYTGMASCLGVMVSRLSALICIHFVGALMRTHCGITLSAFSVYLLSGIVVTYFLPPDKLNK